MLLQQEQEACSTSIRSTSGTGREEHQQLWVICCWQPLVHLLPRPWVVLVTVVAVQTMLAYAGLAQRSSTLMVPWSMAMMQMCRSR